MSEKPGSKSINKRGKGFAPRSVAEIVGKVLEPVLARRAGMTLDLIRAWPEIVGEEFSETTRPEKIDWPRRANEDDPFKPAVLVVACENSAALFFQHEQAPVLERVNVFFGFEAIDRIRIVQKAVVKAKSGKIEKSVKVSTSDEARLMTMLEAIDDPELKERLIKLGQGIISKENKA